MEIKFHKILVWWNIRIDALIGKPYNRHN